MLFPIFVDLNGRRCLIVGGGRVAERKAGKLVAAGARVTVAAKTASAGIRRLARLKKVKLAKRDFSTADLRGVFLVVCATGDAHVQARIAAAAKKNGVLANVADTPALCDFFLPATARRGRLQIAVSTGGSSPLTAKRIARELKCRYGREHADLLSLMRSLRGRVIGCVPAVKRPAVFEAMSRPSIMKLLHKGRKAAARRAMERVIREAIPHGGTFRT
jgi:precorrin-2 dehydrogenase/sirohydrochlorin ferrochelatase